jgi:polysaccharide export outer membrane protein
MIQARTLLVALMLAGCTNLPVDGPSHRDIESGAIVTSAAETRGPRQDYVYVDVTDSVLTEIPVVGPGSFFHSFDARRRTGSDIRLGPGDSIQVTIFESSAGGLFSPGQASLRPGNFVSLPAQIISQNGNITVPYAGDVHVAGQTTQQAEKAIASKLSTRAIEPQVVLTVGDQVASTVNVIGESSSKVPLRANDRVLDVIARTGGTRTAPHELFVTLVRKGQKATVYFPTLAREAKENIFVAPGDIIYVYRDQQKFFAFGAIGSGGQTQGVTGLFPFDAEQISLNEAVAKAGGLVDNQANAAVFVYRLELREALERMGVDVRRFEGQDLIPTVYHLNYRDPSVFFLARRFPMRHKDAIYVANSDSIELDKFLAHTQAISSTVSGVAGDVLSTRDSIRALGQ